MQIRWKLAKRLSSSPRFRWQGLKNKYLKTILLVVIILGSVVAFWFGIKVVYATDYPLLTVASESMTPTLNVGDLIVVQGISDYSQVKAALQPEGDIIVFHESHFNEDQLIVHRAVNKSQGADGLWYFKTQGDHNADIGVYAPDPWTVSERSVVGKVVGRVPWVGYIPLYIRRPEGIALLIVLILIIIFAEYIPIPSKKQEPQKTNAFSLFLG